MRVEARRRFAPKRMAPQATRSETLRDPLLLLPIQSSWFSANWIRFCASELCEDKQIACIFFSFLSFRQGAQLKRHIDATLGSGNLREAVRLPPGVDLNEWLAVNSEF